MASTMEKEDTKLKEAEAGGEVDGGNDGEIFDRGYGGESFARNDGNSTSDGLFQYGGEIFGVL